MEKLQNLSNILIFIGVVFSGLGALGSHYFGNKVTKKKDQENNEKIDQLIKGNNNLQEQIQPFKDYAKSLYPSDSINKALEKLKNKIEKTDKNLKKEKDTIKSLHSELKIDLSGDWDRSPATFIEQISLLGLLKFIDSKYKHESIIFSSTNSTYFSPITEKKVSLSCNLYIEPGNSPLGKNINDLDNYDRIQIFIPMSTFITIKDSKIQVTAINIKLHINNTITMSFSDKPSLVLEIKSFDSQPIYNFAELNICSTADEGVIKKFKVLST